MTKTETHNYEMTDETMERHGEWEDVKEFGCAGINADGIFAPIIRAHCSECGDCSIWTKGAVAFSTAQTAVRLWTEETMDNQETLRGAKIIASRNKEYWDNRQGGHTQRIYTEDAVEEIKSIGRITSRDGETIIVPVGDCAWYHDGKKWVEYGN